MIIKTENTEENRTLLNTKPNANLIDYKGLKPKNSLVFGVRQKREWTV